MQELVLRCRGGTSITWSCKKQEHLCPGVSSVSAVPKMSVLQLEMQLQAHVKGKLVPATQLPQQNERRLRLRSFSLGDDVTHKSNPRQLLGAENTPRH